MARIDVCDTAIGIPVEYQPFIFDRFYRVDKARNRMDGGSGLGLSIVRSIAEAHGGQISVQSTPGKGSTFTVLLPLGGPAGEASKPAVRG
jgi:two-component system sensor histidine kinase BaeS